MSAWGSGPLRGVALRARDVALRLAQSPTAVRSFAFAALAAYGIVLVSHASYSCGGADTSGYLNHARSLSRGDLVKPIPAGVRLGINHAQHLITIPLGYAVGPNPGTMVPVYPPGFPIHMAVLARVFGWERGPFLVSPILAVIGLLVFFALARELGLSRKEAMAGTAILAFQPVYVLLALRPMSDMTATTWAGITVLAALSARRRSEWGYGAGLAFVIGCLVRPTNALLLLPLAFALPMTAAVLARFAVGAAPVLAFALGFNHFVYGHALQTGYGSSVASEFALSFFRRRFNHYTHWLGRTFTPLLPLAWIGVVAGRTRWRDRFLLLTWFLAFFVVFCCYRHYDAWWYLRFMMPAFPALIIGAIVAVRPILRAFRVTVQWPARALNSPNLLPILLLLFVLVGERREAMRQDVFGSAGEEAVYPRACRFAAERLPDNAIVLSFLMSGALEYYTDLTYLRFDTMVPRRTAKHLFLETTDQGYRWFALLHPAELDEFERRDLGEWRTIATTPEEAVLRELVPQSLRGPVRR